MSHIQIENQMSKVGNVYMWEGHIVLIMTTTPTWYISLHPLNSQYIMYFTHYDLDHILMRVL